MALGFDKNRPTGFETPERIVQTTGNGNEFGRHRTIEVRPAKFGRPLKRPILVQDDSFIDKSCPWQKIGEPDIGTAVFGEVHHDGLAHVLRWPGIRRCRRTTSTKSGSRLAAQ